jgi:hypothetical protein
MSLLTDLQTVQSRINGLRNNKVTRFAYDQTAYTDNTVASPQSYAWAQHNNIPGNSPADMKLTETQQNKGFRTRNPSLPKLFIDHFFGRVSYNLNKLDDFMYTFVSAIISSLGANNGFATLDGNGRIIPSQVSESLMQYKGGWNASTNTPHLQNGTGTKGDVYLCSEGGTVDFGSGNITFEEGDRVLYDGSVWEQISKGKTKTVCDIGASADGNIDLLQQTDITKILNERVLRALFWWRQE